MYLIEQEKSKLIKPMEKKLFKIPSMENKLNDSELLVKQIDFDIKL